jgi:octaprenyl-diphosphate synthase
MELKFYESMTQVGLLNRITYYIVNRKGKQMRPMFVFPTAKNDHRYRKIANFRGGCVLN